MINADEILKSIALTGAVDEASIAVRIATKEQANQISNSAGGKLKITKPFKLILSQPESLKVLSSLEIRCCLCHKVISYPCWYRKHEFAVNHFHFFVCFDSSSPSTITTKCFKGVGL